MNDFENGTEGFSEEMEDFEALLNAHLQRVNNGDVKEARVLAVNPDYLLVDVGSYMDGIVPKEELLEEGETMSSYKVGDVLTLTVTHVNTRESQITLSKRAARKVVAWKEMAARLAAEDVVEVKVTKAVRGGLRVSCGGAEGFIPASQVADRYVEDLAPYEGQTLRVILLELSEEKKEFTASARRVLEAEKKETRKRLYETLEEGQRLSGKVVRLADFGAFVQLAEGVDGLVHVSDLSWSRVKHPSELLAVGDTVAVTVKSVDREKERISLYLKDLGADPWELTEFTVGEYREGCRVNHIIDTGAFVSVAPGIEGFLPISQISEKKLRTVKDVLAVGDELRVRITRVDKEKRQLSLSMREVEAAPEVPEEETHYEDKEEAGTSLGGLFSGLKL